MARLLTTNGFPEFKKLTDDLGVVGWNGILFGLPGVGKTTLALTAERDPNDSLLVDVDQGRESVLDIDAPFYVPTSYDDMEKLFDTALTLKGESPVKTWVFDSLSTIYYELILPKVSGGPKAQVKIQHYGEAQKLLLKFIRDAKSLAAYGINTIFIGHAHEDRENIGSKDDPSYILNIRLGLPPKVREEVLLSVNHVGYYERVIKGSTESRILHFRPPRKVFGPKVRQTQSGGQLALEITNPNFGDILETLRGSK